MDATIESEDEKKLKIGQHLAKLWQKYNYNINDNIFLTHNVYMSQCSMVMLTLLQG